MAKGPSGSTARGLSLGGPPRFVGQQLGLGEQPVAVAIVDLDGDGDQDLAVGDFLEAITTAFNQGGGDFEAGGTYPVSGRAVRLVTGDVDGNGSPDLVVCLRGNTPPRIAVLLNQGGGVFAAPVEYVTGAAGWATSAALADVDGDGDRDLAVANLDWRFTLPSGDVLNDSTVAVVLNQGDGTFGAPSETLLGPSDSSPGDFPEESFVVADDLDGDGDADLAVTVGDQDALYVLQNLGAGAFSVSTPYSVDSQPGDLVAADLDGDGDRDVAIVNGGDLYNPTDTFAVFLNQGGGTFAPALSYAGGYSAYSLACADLDGDGDRDLAFNSSDSGPSLCAVMNQGNGAFDPPLELAGHLHAVGVASGDLDGNGTIDLASGNYDTVSLVRNLGNGAFETAPGYAAGSSPRLVTNADVDGDGDRDLVVGSTLYAKVSVLGNLGSGAFAPRVEYDAQRPPVALILPDLDRDGRVDLVTAGGSKAFVRLNQGDGTFGAMAEFSVAPRVSGITSADLDDDGNLDLAVSLASTNTLGVLPGLGNGSLGPAATYPSGFEADAITGGDFDRDGDVDLVLASNDTATARLLDNQGAGTFALLASYPAGGNPHAITSADFDRDGLADLAVLLEPPSQHEWPNVGVLLNLGSGAFGPSTLYTVGYQAVDLLSADIDRDAYPDLVVAAYDVSALPLLMNLGDGTFARRLEVTASRPMGVTCADLDGDGDMDLASTASSEENVEIHFNHCR